ncbi:MAG: zinc ribbon domain-containing protein [Candidatus Micrarchaeota archaeon]
MGIFDNIINQVIGNVKRDVTNQASSGISSTISGGINGGVKKVTTKDNTPKCPKCKKVITDNSLKFCSECGTKMIVSCTKCQQDFAVGTKFCSNCGGTVG